MRQLLFKNTLVIEKRMIKREKQNVSIHSLRRKIIKYVNYYYLIKLCSCEHIINYGMYVTVCLLNQQIQIVHGVILITR